MKKLFLQLFSVIGVLLGAVWTVFIFFVDIWAGTVSDHNESDEDAATSMDLKHEMNPVNMTYDD